jgi:protoporphyrinogen oxidase
MKIGILGGGVSGLSAARLLSKHFEVEVLEQKAVHGGIARTREVDGAAYHVTGGHCFNSKYQEVLNFVFNEVMPQDQWHLVQRNANIHFYGHDITYPIEYAIKQIHDFDPDTAINITRDFLAAKDEGQYENLEQWFRAKFGDTLADLYFIPYNTKIWNKSPKDMSPAWVEGKLPIPDKKSFFDGLIGNQEDKMPHASFYYPNSNNQNTFIDALAGGVNIVYNYTIRTIEQNDAKKWLINNEKEYDILISTLPLNIFPGLIANTPKPILQQAALLKYNKVTTMLWETSGTCRTWTYIPDADSLFHRYIHIGSFFKPVKNYSITEAVGEKSYEEMLESGKKDPFLITPLDYHVSDHAYVVFDDHYDVATKAVKNYLAERGIHTLGRFGEWQYYNMDVCIKSSMDLTAAIIGQFNSRH